MTTGHVTCTPSGKSVPGRRECDPDSPGSGTLSQRSGVLTTHQTSVASLQRTASTNRRVGTLVRARAVGLESPLRRLGPGGSAPGPDNYRYKTPSRGYLAPSLESTVRSSEISFKHTCMLDCFKQHHFQGVHACSHVSPYSRSKDRAEWRAARGPFPEEGDGVQPPPPELGSSTSNPHRKGQPADLRLIQTLRCS